MVVLVKLFATFRKDRFKEKQIELPEKSSMADLLKYLKIPDDQAKILLVNGIACKITHKLKSDDTIAIFPPIAGG